MPRARLAGVIALAVVVVLVSLAVVQLVVAPRLQARARSDWFQRPNLTLAPVVKGLKEPTYVAGPPDGGGRQFVLERAGLVRLVVDGRLRPQPVLDLRAQVADEGEEQGLIGLAFHPDFAHNGLVYLDYTALDRSIEIVRYQISAEDPDALDPASAHLVLSIPKTNKAHNGGMLAFGSDGFLYVGVGDDEDSGQAQDLSSLLGKLLRLDVDGADPYRTPSSNPFADRRGARAEIWAYGLRNPWRFSFDHRTGELWMADVGEAEREEVNLQPAASLGGENYGWPVFEGDLCVAGDHCAERGLVPPVYAYRHDMNCAVIGGFVYRGKAAPGLVGSYVFGDLCTGGVFALQHAQGSRWTRAELGYQPIKISSFGEDAAGELYVVDIQGGTIYRLVDGSLPG